MFKQNRNNKNGGGVALFVRNHLKRKIVANMTVSIDDVMECLTVEISFVNRKNVFVSCIYRAPGSDTQTFIDYIEKQFSDLGNKDIFLCGDMNMDLLKYNEHKPTENFVNLLYSLSMHPKITRPTRITSHSSTLIDNIFTNIYSDDIKSGILVTDVSDHLPIFVIYGLNNLEKIDKEMSEIRLIRQVNEESITAFKSCLTKQNWSTLFEETDVNAAYNTFLETFTTLYDLHCPKKKPKKREKIRSPWFTKGLINACKKKKLVIQRIHRKKDNRIRKKV